MNNGVIDVIRVARGRLGLSIKVSDVQVLEILLADSLFWYQQLHDFMQSQYLASDIGRRRVGGMNEVHGITYDEWQTLYGASVRGVEVGDILETRGAVAMLQGVEEALQFTLREADQAKRWKVPIVKMLVMLALASRDYGTERTTAVLGAIVITDYRRIEDFRAKLETSVPDILLLASVVSAAVRSVLC